MNTLSAYQLACGYVQRHECDGIQTTLWREHGAYHVRTHDFNQHQRIAWNVFRTLTEARREYARQIRMAERTCDCGTLTEVHELTCSLFDGMPLIS